jgi:hypothetical protein
LTTSQLITEHRKVFRQMAFEATQHNFALWEADERQLPTYRLSVAVWKSCQRAEGEAQFGPDLATPAGRPVMSRLLGR